MAGEDGSSKQPPKVAGKNPTSPSGDQERIEEDGDDKGKKIVSGAEEKPSTAVDKGKTVQADEKSTTDLVEKARAAVAPLAQVVLDGAGIGKQVLSGAEEKARTDLEKGKNVLPAPVEKSTSDLQEKARAAVAPLAHLVLDGGGKGKRGAESSGEATAPKLARGAEGNLTQGGGSFVLPATATTTTPGIAAGMSNLMASITSDPVFMANAKWSGMTKGVIRGATGRGPDLPFCIRCRIALATTSVFGPESHLCLCDLCLPLVIQEPHLQCPVCRDDAQKMAG